MDDGTTGPAASVSRRLMAAHSLGIDRATVEVIDELEKDGVRCVLLKGPVIAEWLYPEPGSRGYGDADLLVDPSDLDTAAAVLKRIGFPRPGTVGPRPPTAVPWTRPADGFTVDLHTSVRGVGREEREAWAVIYSNTEEMQLADGTVRVPNVALRAVFVALHAVHHGVAVAKPLADLRRALEVAPDVWTDARALAESLQATQALAGGLRMLPEGERIADELGLPSELPAELILKQSSADRAAITLEWLAEGKGSRIDVLRRLLLPPRDRMMVGQPAGRNALWAYPVYLSGILRRLPGALAQWRRARSSRAER
jgi:hypothetical protein